MFNAAKYRKNCERAFVFSQFLVIHLETGIAYIVHDTNNDWKIEDEEGNTRKLHLEEFSKFEWLGEI